MIGSLQENVRRMLEFMTAEVGTRGVIITEALGKEREPTCLIAMVSRELYKVLPSDSLRPPPELEELLSVSVTDEETGTQGSLRAVPDPQTPKQDELHQKAP